MRSILQVRASWLAAVLCLIFLSSTGAAATHRVPSQYPTIQAGLDAAAVGDTVLVAAGTYTGAGNVGLMYRRDLVLRSESGPEATVIDVENRETAGFLFSATETRGAVLDGFTIRGGMDPGGTIGGGGVSCFGGSPTITNCILRDNQRGAIWIIGSPVIRDCLIEGPGYGIVVESTSQPEIVNCTIRGVSNGIDCWDYTSRPTVRNCIINGNYGFGVGLYGAPEAEIVDCEISRNAMGGIHGGPGRIVGCTIANNQHYGLVIVGNITVERSIIWGNCAEQGSDIFVDGASLNLNCCAWPDSGVYTIRGGQVISNGPQVETDPHFCGALPCPNSGETSPGGDYSLRSDSPCLAEFSPCQEQIGFRGVGCQAQLAAGACCLGESVCVLATPPECAGQQGVYKGDGVSCYPDPCGANPVEHVTWGQAKARFR